MTHIRTEYDANRAMTQPPIDYARIVRQRPKRFRRLRGFLWRLSLFLRG